MVCEHAFVCGDRKTCGNCKRDLPCSAFNRAGAGLQHWCRDCFRDYFARRGATHLDQVVASRAKRVAAAKAHTVKYLRAHPCADCGESDVRVLDFDHIGEKRELMSSLVARGAPWTRILEEIAECEVRCANCHRRVTAQRAGWSRLAGDVDDARRGFSAPVRRNLNRVHGILARSACADCGERDMLVLEFDHVGVKCGQVSKMVFNVSLATLEREIAECEIGCCNCHRRVTAARRALGRKTGSTVSVEPP
jgi:ArsR family metal-binding transcriptional regulator